LPAFVPLLRLHAACGSGSGTDLDPERRAEACAAALAGRLFGDGALALEQPQARKRRSYPPPADLGITLPVYAAFRVPSVWGVDPSNRTLDVFRLDPSGKGSLSASFAEDDPVRAEPFDPVDIALGSLWVDPLRGPAPP